MIYDRYSFPGKNDRNEQSPTRYVLESDGRYLSQMPGWWKGTGCWTENIHRALSFNGWESNFLDDCAGWIAYSRLTKRMTPAAWPKVVWLVIAPQ